MADRIVHASRRNRIGFVCLSGDCFDLAETAHPFMVRKQALRFAQSIVARRAKLVRARGGRTAGMSTGSADASAPFLAQALARIAALPPGFTDHLRQAPPFPPDAPELLGGD